MTWNIVDAIVSRKGWDGFEKDYEAASKMFPNDPQQLYKYYAKRCLDNKLLDNLQYLEQMDSLND
jgi:hypothetical protein